MFQELIHDLKYSFRALVKRPGFSLITALTLGLGIGANTAIFSLVQGVLLKPPPYPESERVVRVWTTRPDVGRFSAMFSFPNFADLREINRTYESLAVFHDWAPTLTGEELPVSLNAMRVARDFFSVLRVSPALGRDFRPEEERSDGAPAALISHTFWRQHFGLASDVLSQTLHLDGLAHTIVGVLPEDFRFEISGDTGDVAKAQEVDVWVTLRMDAAQNRGRDANFMWGLGRLKAGVTLEQAQSDMDAIGHRLSEEYPKTNKNRSFRLEPLHESLVSDLRIALLTLFGAVGLVLLIACANVSHMLLARAIERSHELVLRSALGASRMRIIRQLLIESLFLAVAGGGFGIVIASVGVPFLLRLSPASIPGAAEIGIDLGVLLFTLVLCLLTALVFGVGPSLLSMRFELRDALHVSGTGLSEGRGRLRLRRFLVITEFALAFLLLLSAGLLVQSFLRLQQTDPGFRPDRLLAATMSFSVSQIRDDSFPVFYQRLLDEMQVLPSVEAAAIVAPLPFGGNTIRLDYRLAEASEDDSQDGNFRAISPGYFDTMGIELVKGRAFTSFDRADTTKVVIVNESLARECWPNENPLGKRLYTGYRGYIFEVVGVVRDIKHVSLAAASGPEFYTPYPQTPWRFLDLVVRTRGEPMEAVDELRTALHKIHPEFVFASIRPMKGLLSDSLSQPRFRALLLALFAFLALGLSIVGIYGVISYSVGQRTQEIGIRSALGASPRSLLGLIIGEGLRMALIGIGFGALGGFVLTRLLSRFLFQIDAIDLPTFFATGLALLGVASIACFVPASRVLRFNTTATLKAD